MSTQPKHLLTPEEYLEIERKAEFRSEYSNGEMFAISGGTRQHDCVAVDTMFALRTRLGNPCRVFSSNMRVYVPSTGLYTYPDISVVYGKQRFSDDAVDTLLNPILIVEVLSKSTEAYDRGKKAENYRTIESLKGYLLLAQERPHAELFVRGDNATWVLTESKGADSSIEIPFLQIALPLAELYAGAEAE